ncbi:MAG: hypothetical protein J0I14_16815 [Propionibacteriaceae bacterium]|nr:hypothetical protein [Propionibacteriaceae bacterium]
MDVLHVDCATCRARGPACDDCAISVLLGPMPADLGLDDDERTALAELARVGLIPPLRMVSGA